MNNISIKTSLCFHFSQDSDVYVRLGRLAKEYSDSLETIKQIRSVQNDGESDDEMADEEMVSEENAEKIDSMFLLFHCF